MLKTAVIGASGFTGKELVKILSAHPSAEVSYASARVDEPVLFSGMFPEYRGEIDILCENLDKEKAAQKADVIFLALPHKVSFETAPFFIREGKIVIDLSADYRLKDLGIYEKFYGSGHKDKENLDKFVYGLPEFFREKIRTAKFVANPGCYSTVSLLAVLPLVKHGLLSEPEVIIDAKSGVSGAGKKAKTEPLFSFANTAGNFWAYKPFFHQHTPEIEQGIFDVCGREVKVRFCPQVLPIERGIFISVYAYLCKKLTLKDLQSLYLEYYQKEPFVRVLDSIPQIKQAVNTNFCDLGFGLSDDGKVAAVFGAIDNLIKGAAGQAVQNMNIVCGLEETAGLL